MRHAIGWRRGVAGMLALALAVASGCGEASPEAAMRGDWRVANAADLIPSPREDAELADVPTAVDPQGLATLKTQLLEAMTITIDADAIETRTFDGNVRRPYRVLETDGDRVRLLLDDESTIAVHVDAVGRRLELKPADSNVPPMLLVAIEDD